jgi:hypothetical protein
MDTYTGYREAPLARSPTERVNWGSRDEVPRSADRADRPDTFYRGRSPGMWNFIKLSCTGHPGAHIRVNAFNLVVFKPMLSTNASTE